MNYVQFVRTLLAFLFGLIFAQGAWPAVGSPQDYFDEPNQKAMAQAIAEDDVQTVRALLRSGVVSPHTIGRNDANWLVVAIAGKSKKAFQALLEEGALGPKKGRIAGQALYAATVSDDMFWLTQLRSVGADLNNYGGGRLLLVVALDTRDTRKFRFYLENGADVNMTTPERGSAALSMAQTKRFDVVNQLLDLGASPWVMDARGETLGFAAEDAASLRTWKRGSPMDAERLKLLERLHAIGFPEPAPNLRQARALRDGGVWPPRRS